MKNSILISIGHKMGIDKSIAYSSGSRIVQGVAGVGSVFFISTYLTGIEQGFYFTFGSILALQVFFELGLTGIMTQYVAHEASHLILNDCKIYEGEAKYKSRLASLIHFCVKWYSVLAVVAFFFLLLVGFIFFTHYDGGDSTVSWRIPWLLICLGTAIKLFQSPFNSIYMGLGKVKEMSEIVFYQQIIIPASVWIGLVCGFKLYVVGIGYIFSVIVWQLYVYRNHLDKIIINLWKEEIKDRVVYFKEIFPFQWRIALSWISGYFIFQLFNPVLFATEGAVVAGQMGMTLHALTAIQSLAMSWMNTKVPLYSNLIALKDYCKLDEVFGRTLKQMVCVCSLLLVVFFIIIWLLNETKFEFGGNVLAYRFLGYVPTLLLMTSVFLQQYVTSWATYLRCHKQEPFLALSVCQGVACCLSTVILGNLYGLYGITVGYCLIIVAFLPWGYWIFKTKKEKWHK